MDSYRRKCSKLLLDYALGKISKETYKRKIAELDAQEPYVVIEETWRTYDGGLYVIRKILERKTFKIISETKIPIFTPLKNGGATK
jgi:hypothetical protein